MMISEKYDDASWHSGADNFPKDLPPSAGATHIGMYFAWAVLNGLCSDEHLSDCAEEVEKLKSRESTPGAYVYKNLDGKLLTGDLNLDGNAFTSKYLDLSQGMYIDDYCEATTEEEDGEIDIDFDPGSIYRVEDSWEVYDRVAPLFSKRFEAWQKERSE
ncbi:MAG: hypothetical protein ABJ370_11790 [Paracoccaceae bacterium]